jgi:hypothetical protein
MYLFREEHASGLSENRCVFVCMNMRAKMCVSVLDDYRSWIQGDQKVPVHL